MGDYIGKNRLSYLWSKIKERTLGKTPNVSADVDVVDIDGQLLYKAADATTWGKLSVGDLAALLEPVSTSVRVVDQTGSTIQQFNKTSATANLQVMVTSRQKDNQAGTDWQPTGELVTLTVEKRETSGAWTTVQTLTGMQSGTTVTVDVRAALTVGDNLIRMSAEGMTTEVTSPYLVYQVELVVVYPTISIESLEWWRPQSGDLAIPLLFGGEMNKTMHIDIVDDQEDGSSYSFPLGTSPATNIPRTFTCDAPAASGVYKVRAWITTDDVEVSSPVVERNILWVATGDTGKWMVVNSVAEGLTNWMDNTVMEYMLYDTSGTTSTLSFSLMMGTTEVYHADLTSVDQSRHTLVIPLEIYTGVTQFNTVLTATDIVEDGETPTTFGTWTLPVDNTENYAAVEGTTFFLNPKTRTNSDSNRAVVVNAVNGEEIETEVTGISFSSADMWTTDANGERCLRVNAGQRVWFDFNPFATNVAQGVGVTVEIDYKVDSVSDYDTVAVNISRETSTGFVGLRLEANRMLLCTQATASEGEQELITDDGVRIKAAVTVVPRAYTFQDTTGATRYLNLVRYYINGKINRCFEIQNTDVLTSTTGTTIGSDDCDVYIYSIRCNGQKLDFKSVHQNYVNLLPTNAEKAEEKAFNDIYDNDEVSFAKVRAKGLNAFVTDKPFPSLKVDEDYDLGGATDRKDVTLELYVLTAIYNYIKAVPTRQGGQGTSSMRYWEWNQRLRILKNTTVTYGINDEVVDVTSHEVSIWDILPPTADLTMKKNWASGMQDHKCGSVNTLTDVWKLLGYSNAAVDEDERVRISVYQEPFTGWYKKEMQDGSFKYVCMGNFTGGPHKGDKKCFGYNLSMFPGTLSMEGCNNDPVLTNFKMPWDNEHVRVDTSDDILVMYRTGFDGAGNAQWTKAWEQDFGPIEEGDSNAVATEKLALFIDAYNDIYRYNPYIAPWEGTVAQLNAAAAQWADDLANGRMTQAEYATKIGTEYWLADAGATQYDLTCYDPSTGTFYQSTIDGQPVNVGEWLN